MSAETRKRDPVTTRASILSSAEELFVERGFAATSMTEIAKVAEVTKSLIHHHFGSKEELWQEIKRHRMAQWLEVQKRLLIESADGDHVFEESLRNYFRFLQENPEFVRLSAWMSLEDPRLSEAVDPELIELASRRLVKEQQEGRLRSDVDARHILAMLLSLTMHWFVARNSFVSIRVADPDQVQADEAYLEDMMRVFLAGVRPARS